MIIKSINTESIFLRELDDALNLNYSLYPEYKNRIEEFAYDKLGRTLSSSQLKMADSLIHNKVVNVKAGHGLGKSDFIAILHFYWVYVVGGQCVSTAPSYNQLMENIWNPINI
jgi:reverse gyrase